MNITSSNVITNGVGFHSFNGSDFFKFVSIQGCFGTESGRGFNDFRHFLEVVQDGEMSGEFALGGIVGPGGKSLARWEVVRMADHRWGAHNVKDRSRRSQAMRAWQKDLTMLKSWGWV